MKGKVNGNGVRNERVDAGYSVKGGLGRVEEGIMLRG